MAFTLLRNVCNWSDMPSGVSFMDHVTIAVHGNTKMRDAHGRRVLEALPALNITISSRLNGGK
jgi:hypothetical protein